MIHALGTFWAPLPRADYAECFDYYSACQESRLSVSVFLGQVRSGRQVRHGDQDDSGGAWTLADNADDRPSARR
ncbi:hypothetical protein FRAAL6631 [Frankia alni ACN14a]|uniref:Uncharacterized protein n=1 Tax=Frankia alni (strain DSM 45986 / CECT 9034 / ACN14a) TaxID=326424 RepID=Q0RBD2_FRAAA|nr:hypothetical protein FRAAL6631 [Frankia alni ACN14a]